MAEPLTILTSLAIVIVAGILVSMIASKLGIPDVLLLILAGMGLAQVSYKGAPIVSFPLEFLISLGLLALAVIVFDGAARIKIKELGKFYLTSSKLVLVFLAVNLLIFPFATKYFLGASLGLGFLLAAINSGTAAEIALLMLKGKQKVAQLLKFESIINTPITVILPFLVLDFIKRQEVEIATTIISNITQILTKIAVGIGAGILIGLILFKLLKRKGSEIYAPIAIIIAALLAFVLSENMNGDGVIAVTALGLFIGNFYFKEKLKILATESAITKTLYIIVFMLLGIMIKLPYTTSFLVYSGILFGIYLILRFIAVSIVLRKSSIGEKIFAALNATKGIATAVVVFILSTYTLPGTKYYTPGIGGILNIAFAFILYSLLLSTIVIKVYNLFSKTPQK